MTQGGLAVQQKRQPFKAVQSFGLSIGGQFVEGFGHAMKAKGVKLGEGWMLEHVDLS